MKGDVMASREAIGILKQMFYTAANSGDHKQASALLVAIGWYNHNRDNHPEEHWSIEDSLR